MQTDTTDFGFKKVDTNEKEKLVRGVFNSVAERYDLMNDLMSLGIHRLWKRFAIQHGQFRPGHRVLDLAGGTGDLTKLIAPKVGAMGEIILCDINQSMLQQGRKRLQDEGLIHVNIVQANAEQLSFPDNYFDRIIIGFGLRNVTDKNKALKSMFQVLKPGGRLIVLEFSQPTNPLLSKAYDLYSFNVLPKIGEWVAQDKDSYQYLAESIRMHPNQETLKQMILDAGFDECEYINLNGGIVAIHKGIKY